MKKEKKAENWKCKQKKFAIVASLRSNTSPKNNIGTVTAKDETQTTFFATIQRDTLLERKAIMQTAAAQKAARNQGFFSLSPS